MPVVEIYRSTSRRSAALGLPPALSMNSPSPYVSAAQFISPSSTLVFLTLKPMLRYQSTVALTSGTWIIGVTVIIREPPAGPDGRIAVEPRRIGGIFIERLLTGRAFVIAFMDAGPRGCGVGS